MADELYQEFFLTICEIKDLRLIEAQINGYLDVLCVGIINNIWGKRFRVKRYETGRTNPLFEVSNFIDADRLSTHQNDYDYDKDQNIEKAHTFITELIEASKEANDQSERFRARVFEYSHIKYNNVRQFSRASGIPYNVCIEAHNTFKEKIKWHMS